MKDNKERAVTETDGPENSRLRTAVIIISILLAGCVLFASAFVSVRIAGPEPAMMYIIVAGVIIAGAGSIVSRCHRVHKRNKSKKDSSGKIQ